MFRSISAAAVIAAMASTAVAGDGNYSSDFANADGNYWGSATHTTPRLPSFESLSRHLKRKSPSPK